VSCTGSLIDVARYLDWVSAFWDLGLLVGKVSSTSTCFLIDHGSIWKSYLWFNGNLKSELGLKKKTWDLISINFISDWRKNNLALVWEDLHLHSFIAYLAL